MPASGSSPARTSRLWLPHRSAVPDVPISHERTLTELREWIDESLERWHTPGAAVGIVRDQDLAWSAVLGYAEIASDRQPDEHTLILPCVDHATGGNRVAGRRS